jgi:tetratricopeptide (TPR) repeat protein
MSYLREVVIDPAANKTTARARGCTSVRRLAVLVAALALGAPAARAGAAEPPDEKTAQAKALSQEANALYAVGDFAQAAEKYQSAYKLKPDPALLYNAAQSSRMAGNNEKALLLYKNYAMFYPNARNITNVELQITKLQEAISAQHKAQTQPPTTTEPTAGASTGVPAWTGVTTTPAATGSTAESGGAAATSTPANPSGAGATGLRPTDPSSSSGAVPGTTLTETAPAPSGDTPLYKKWWLWTAVGVAAGGVAAVVLLSGRSSKAWSTAPDFGPGAAN